MIKEESHHGKQADQKMKPFLVLQFLMKNSDENHTVSAPDIVDYLQNECEIYAERRSIYRDIEEINKALLMTRDEISIQEASDLLEEDEEEKFIVYDKSKKGFYARQRQYDVNDVRMLAECVYSTKSISQSACDRLIEVLCGLTSDFQAEQIKHDAYLVDRQRVKTNIQYALSTITEAMSTKIEGVRHTPEQITFKYLYYDISDIQKQKERKKTYCVSPFRILINDDYYYLLAFDDDANDMRTYRIDRMKGVSRTGKPRNGEKFFHELDMAAFARKHFGMFSGREEHITLRFTSPLLNAVIDRFGTKEAFYLPSDKDHFTVSVAVDISDNFFSWICQFGNKVKIISPASVVDDFKSYLTNIQKLYGSN